MEKKKIYQFNSNALIVILLGLLVVVNFLASKFFLRWDLTENKTYTVSKTTQNLLVKLDDLITIKAYFTQKLPPNLLQTTNYVKDLLGEYQAYSKGNLKVVYLDPTDDLQLANEARSLGIPEIQFQTFEKDKASVQKGYLGIAVLFEDKSEIIPVVKDLGNLEYDLTLAITKVSGKETKVVGFVAGEGEKSLTTDYQAFNETLQKIYQTKEVKLEKDKIEGVDTLIIAGPTEKFSDAALYLLDQFILGGGNLIFLVDAFHLEQGLQAKMLETNLPVFLENFGVRVNRDVVLDLRANENASFSSGFVQFFLPYPFWPKLIKDGFSDNPIVAKLESFMLPWASSVESIQKEGVTAEILATTTDYGSTQTEPFNFDPQARPNLKKEDLKKVPVAVALRGKFTSYFKGKIKPLDLTDAREESAKEARLIVVGDSDFPGQNFGAQFPENLNLALNMVDYLTLDQNLISIRSKGVVDRPILGVSKASKGLVRAVNLALVPLLVVCYGLFRAYLRRKNKTLQME